jgi:hypothetical protein
MYPTSAGIYIWSSSLGSSVRLRTDGTASTQRERDGDDSIAYGRDPLAEEEESERTLSPGSPAHPGRLPARVGLTACPASATAGYLERFDIEG